MNTLESINTNVAEATTNVVSFILSESLIPVVTAR
jgi:hypothetical protein